MRTTSERFVVGLAGTNASGKSLVGRFLKGAGYEYVSLSDGVRSEAAARRLATSRENLIMVANDLRRAFGPSVLAERVAAMFSKERYAVDSIRSPFEVDVLKKTGRFLLLGVDAPITLRYERARARGRDESAETLEDFARIEARERTTDPAAQQLDETMRRADRVFVNDATPAALEADVTAYLSERGFPVKPAA